MNANERDLALSEAQEAVHVQRFAHKSREGGTVGGPDSFYNGMRHAESIIRAMREGEPSALAIEHRNLLDRVASQRTSTVTLADAEALRDHLDALNEAGTTPIAVGWDATPQPFLITLVGAYADGEDVFFDSPWQDDRDYGERIDGVWVPKPPHCEECRAQVHGIDDLRYPVIVLAGPVAAGSL